MKYEFRVQPGADPSRIQLRYEGADGLRLGEEGELRIDIGGSQLLDEPPHTFQQIGGRTVNVSSSYVLWRRTVGLALRSATTTARGR